MDAVETREGRRELAKTVQGFCFCYLTHYLTLPPAEFHPEMLYELQSSASQFLAITGYRGCAKSTFASFASVLQKAAEHTEEFIIVINDTRPMARLTIENIKFELEENELLIEDYGDFAEGISKTKAWTNTMLLLSSGVRILGLSRGQKIRGIKHKQHRPGYVVADDLEELKKVQSKDYRDGTELYLTGDVIPSIEEAGGRLVVIGNMVHTDGIMARIKNGKIAGGIFKYLEYPLIAEDGHVTWVGKYPNEVALKRQETKVGRTSWLREYLLKVVPPEGQEIQPEWIKYYDTLPGEIVKSGTGVDLAISKASTADYTAMVSGIVGRVEGVPHIYVMPNPVNERLSALETQNKMRDLSNALKTLASPTFFIEEVAYQKAAIEFARACMLPVVGVRPGADKRARLKTGGTFIQQGMVLFPRTGCEDLLAQLLGFGVESHDDLVDALVYLIFGLSDEGMDLPEVKMLY